MRANPKLDIETAITELATGEALVSLLDDKGRPSRHRARLRAAAGEPDRPDHATTSGKALIAGSLVAGVYEKTVDRESAYEKLNGRVAASPPAPRRRGAGRCRRAAPAERRRDGGGMLDGLKDAMFGITGPRGGKHEGLAEVAARSAVRTIGSSVGREIIRGVLGSLLGGVEAER